VSHGKDVKKLSNERFLWMKYRKCRIGPLNGSPRVVTKVTYRIGWSLTKNISDIRHNYEVFRASRAHRRKMCDVKRGNIKAIPTPEYKNRPSTTRSDREKYDPLFEEIRSFDHRTTTPIKFQKTQLVFWCKFQIPASLSHTGDSIKKIPPHHRFKGSLSSQQQQQQQQQQQINKPTQVFSNNTMFRTRVSKASIILHSLRNLHRVVSWTQLFVDVFLFISRVKREHKIDFASFYGLFLTLQLK
jgi:hypothetical protein